MQTSKKFRSFIVAAIASLLSLKSASAQTLGTGGYQLEAQPEFKALQMPDDFLHRYGVPIISGQGNALDAGRIYDLLPAAASGNVVLPLLRDYPAYPTQPVNPIGIWQSPPGQQIFDIRYSPNFGSVLDGGDQRPEIQYPANPDGIFGSPLGQKIFAGIPSDILYPTNPDGVVAGAAQLPAGRLILPEELRKVTWNTCAKMSLNLRVAFNTDRSTTPPEAVAFDRACLSPISDIPLPLRDTGIERTVGFLTIEQDGKETAFCTALRFSKTKIVTAKHCFFDKSKGSTKAQYDYLQYGMVRLYLLGDLSKPYVLDYVQLAAPSSSGAIPTSDDYVILPVDTRDTDLPAINMNEPVPLQALTTPGINGYLVTDDWRDQLRWSSANMCFVLQLNNGCLVHGCNTTSGFSGAPVFSLHGDGGIEVVGLHSSGGNQDASCGTGLFYESSNMATLMAGNLMADLQ
ncbi:hypothetical protein TH19_03195 [Thalassospira profundimaris]|uniref:Peptidase S1 domain-containing protein n=1 Tax=Thalassospira profundimaris TaxID=502049 RepID=A0A367WBJ9_9PROT|nr:hypothetical protein TH19_03195 [Thalassospira profundimaris]